MKFNGKTNISIVAYNTILHILFPLVSTLLKVEKSFIFKINTIIIPFWQK